MKKTDVDLTIQRAWNTPQRCASLGNLRVRIMPVRGRYGAMDYNRAEYRVSGKRMSLKRIYALCEKE